jgi:hypothetical protein
VAQYAPVLSDVFVGEPKTLQFTIFQADGVTPQNTAGYSFEWVLRASKWSALAIVTKVDGNGISHVNDAAGRIDVAILRADTLGVVSGTYYHSLRRTNAGSESILSFGEFVLSEPATR